MRQNFESGIVKIDVNGNRVMSDYLDEGETLAPTSRIQNPVISSGHDSARMIDESGAAPVSAAGAAHDNMAPVDINGSDKSVTGEPSSRQAGGPEAPLVEETEEAKAAREDAAGEQNSDEQQSGETEEAKATREAADAAPKEYDNKDAWFAYAQTKGFTGEKDDLTKAEYLTQYGASK